MRNIICLLVILYVSFGKGYGQNADKKKVWTRPDKGKILDRGSMPSNPLTAFEKHIYGKVRSVSYTEYEFSDKYAGRKVFLDSGCDTYDLQGHLISEKEYGASGIRSAGYIYNDNHKVARYEVQPFGHEKKSVWTYKYDKRGNDIEDIVVDADSLPTTTFIRKYDAHDNEVEEAKLYSSGQKFWRTDSFGYNSRGDQVSWKVVNEDGYLEVSVLCEYDDRHNITSQSCTTVKRYPVISKFKYDSNDNVIEEDLYGKEGVIESKTIKKYNPESRVVESIVYRADGSINEGSS